MIYKILCQIDLICEIFKSNIMSISNVFRKMPKFSNPVINIDGSKRNRLNGVSWHAYIVDGLDANPIFELLIGFDLL